MAEPLLTFGDFSFDRAALRLKHGDTEVALTGLPLRMLEMLLDSGGRLVSRGEFKLALWPHAARIDTERRLNTAMRALREALGDKGAEPRFIETVRGRGYRWIGAEKARPKAERPWLAIAAMLVLLLLPLGGAPAPAPSGHELVEARLALEHWLRDPTPSRRAAVEISLASARYRLGKAPALDTLAADYALAGRWDWPTAEALYRRALAHEPTNHKARAGLAWLLVHSGRNAEALVEVERLIPLAPLGGDGRAEIGWMLLRLDRPERALALCGDERHLNLLSCRHTALARLGRTGEALQAGIALMQVAGASEARIAEVGSGDADEAYRRFLAWRVAEFLPAGGSGFQQAQLLADAGRLDEAMAALERAHAVHDPLMVRLASTAEFAPLTGSPRYRTLLASVGG